MSQPRLTRPPLLGLAGGFAGGLVVLPLAGGACWSARMRLLEPGLERRIDGSLRFLPTTVDAAYSECAD